LGYTVACRAFGNDCDYIVHGETIEELMEQGIRHVKEVHGHTDAQIKSWSTPKNQARLMKLVKQE
jgi:predicted small metal-binding protein